MPLFLPVTTFKRGQRLEVWGCVRPARYVPAGQRSPVEIQFAPGGATFHTVATVPLTDPHGYFDVLQAFPGSGSVRLNWSYPDRSVIVSRTVRISVR